jgi:hypothetical protein
VFSNRHGIQTQWSNAAYRVAVAVVGGGVEFVMVVRVLCRLPVLWGSLNKGRVVVVPVWVAHLLLSDNRFVSRPAKLCW